MRFRFGECVLDETSRELLRGGESVHLTPKAFQLLAILIGERPRAVAKSELQERLWPTTYVAESNLPALIREVRTAIDDSARGGRHIRTVHAFGYAFCGTAEELGGDDVPSLAIFPLDNPAQHPDLAFVALGVPEGVINVISRMPEFRVTPRATAFRLSSLAADLPSLRKRLGVRWIVTGHVTGSSSAVAVQIDIIDTASAKQMWGGLFRRRASEMAGLEGEIAREIVTVLSPRPAAVEKRGGTADSEAYVLDLKGRFHWNRRTFGSLQKAVELFREAAECDPRYVAPRVGLAEAYVTIGTRDHIDPRQAFRMAEEYASAALEIDPASAEAHAALAAVEEIHHWNWTGAEQRHRKAIALQPNNATVMQWFALHLSRRGRHDEARQCIEKAAGLDPLSLIIGTNRALVSYLRHDFQAAAATCAEVLELDPDFQEALLVQAISVDAGGDGHAAWPLYDRMLAASPESPHVLGFYAHSLACAGRTADATALTRRIDAARQTRFVSDIFVALPLLALGRLDDAFAAFESALDQRSSWAVYLKTEPRMQAFRDDARYVRLLNRMNLWRN